MVSQKAKQDVTCKRKKNRKVEKIECKTVFKVRKKKIPVAVTWRMVRNPFK